MALLILDCQWGVMADFAPLVRMLLVPGHFCKSQSLHGVTLKCLIIICSSNPKIQNGLVENTALYMLCNASIPFLIKKKNKIAN